MYQNHLDVLRQKLLHDGSVVIDVKVIPRSQSAEVVELMADGALKVKVRAAPEAGKANEELCELIAQHLGVAKRNLDVIAGRASQRKRIRVVK